MQIPVFQSKQDSSHWYTSSFLVITIGTSLFSEQVSTGMNKEGVCVPTLPESPGNKIYTSVIVNLRMYYNQKGLIGQSC